MHAPFRADQSVFCDFLFYQDSLTMYSTALILNEFQVVHISRSTSSFGERAPNLPTPELYQAHKRAPRRSQGDFHPFIELDEEYSRI